MLDYTSFIFKIVICFLLSACIGIERQYRRRTVGLRTTILVSLGAFLFVRFSYTFPNSDMTRIAAQVVAGIGFLGAGVIIKDGKSVKGLTTAATLWCAAAIGILCSANLIFEAAIGTLLILFTNIILRTVNSKINNLSSHKFNHEYSFTITCEEKSEKEIIRIIKEIAPHETIKINNIENDEVDISNIKISIKLLSSNKKNDYASNIMQKISGRSDVVSISLDKEENILDEEE